MVNPTPNTAAPPRKKQAPWPVIAIFLIALAPVVLALLAYYVPSTGLRPEGMSNYGKLIVPQRAIPDAGALALKTLDGQPFDLKSLHGKWILLSADQAACPESCVKKLFVLRNSHASQGKNVDRLTRVWFVTDNADIPAQVLEAYKGTHFVRADPVQLAAFLTPAAAHGDIDTALRAPMWIIDPLGHLMMEFPRDADATEVRDDIKTLLKNSRVG